MSSQSKKFSIYLLREGAGLDFSTLRVNKATTVEELPEATGLPFPHKAFVVRNKVTKPKWAQHLSPHFDLDELQNQTSSVVLLFQAADRTWALCYGNGFHLIAPGSTEPGFGLRVVANSIDPSAIRSADARTPDVVSRTIRAQVSAGSPIAELGVAVDKELVKHLAGRVGTTNDDDEPWARRLAGSDSLQINATWDLAELGDRATFLLSQFNSTSYQEFFGFIDNFRPLTAKDPLTETLDGLLGATLDARRFEKISLAAPEVIDEDRFDHYKVMGVRQSAELDDLRLEDLYQLLADWGTEGLEALSSVSLVAVDGDGGAASTKRELHRYVAAEIDHDGKTYMLVAGQWFVVDRGYVERINSAIERLVAQSTTRTFPTWQASMSEREYNESVAVEDTWISMDGVLFNHGGPHQKIELCDLAGVEEPVVVHVKKMSSSATLSHLWAQGVVASELYSLDSGFAAQVRAALPHLPDAMRDITLVYAVANDRDGELQDELFFFSKVHLVQQLETLRLIGCPVELVKIKIE